MSDEELIAQGNFLRRLAYALLRDEQAAEDVVQEAYLAALKRPAIGPGWLTAVVRNLALKRLRGNKRRRAREQATGQKGPAPSAAEATAQIELQAKVVAAVRRLDEPYRRTILLRYYYGRTPTGIADELGEPVATIKTRLRRALAKLRVSMDESTGGRSTWAIPLAGLILPSRSAAALTAGAMVMGKKLMLIFAAVLLLAAGFLVSYLQSHDPDSARPRRTSATARLGPTTPDPVVAAAETGAIVTVTVVDEKARPVEGAKVVVFRKLPRPPDPMLALALRLGEKPRTLTDGVTDARGKTELHGLPDDLLDIAATHDGYARARGTVWLRVRKKPELKLVLRPGYPLEGQVRTHGGKPVAGALVCAGPPSLASGNGRALAAVKTRTDQHGTYRFARLAANDHAILAAWPGGAPRYIATVRVPAVRRFDIALPDAGVVTGVVRVAGTGDPVAGATVIAKGTVRDLTVAATAVTDAQGAYRIETLAAESLWEVKAYKEGYVSVPAGSWHPRLMPVTQDVTLRRAAILFGTVRSPDGPVPWATVQAYQLDEGGQLRHYGSTQGGPSETGQYRTTLPPGRTYLDVFAMGYELADRPSTQNPVEILKNATGNKSYIVDIAGPGEHPLDLRMIAGDGVIEGRVVDALDRPLPGVRVGSVGRHDQSAEDGSFHIEGIVRKDRIPALSAHKDGYRTLRTWDRPWPENGEILGVVLKLEPLRSARCRALKDGRAVPGAYVLQAAARTSQVPAGSDDSWMRRREWASLWHRALRIELDDKGECEITLPSEFLYVRADAPGCAPTPFQIVRPGRTDDLGFKLVAGRTVRGRVVLAGSGQPVAGARISYEAKSDRRGEPENSWFGRSRQNGPSETVAAVSGDDGAFELSGLAPSAYTVWAEGTHVTVGRATLPARADEFTIEVKPFRTIAGVVVHGDGQPAAGLRVFVRRARGTLPDARHTMEEDQAFRFHDRVYSAITDSAGRFEYAMVYDGHYSVGVDVTWTRDHNFAEAKLEGVAAGTRDVRLVLRAGLAIEGRVVDQNGRGFAKVFLVARRGGRQGQTTSGKDGRFHITGLDAGPHKVTFWYQDGPGILPQAVGTIEAGTSGLVIELVTVEGLLVDGAGTPLPHHPIQIQRKGDLFPKRSVLKRTTDASGRFIFPALLPGRYRLAHPPPRGGGPTLLFTGGADVGAGPHRIVAVRGATVSGRLVGAVFTRSYVSALLADREHRLYVPVREDGTFVITGLARDEVVTIQAWGAGHGVARRENVRAGTAGLEIRVPK